MHCKRCGDIIEKEYEFCPNCGNRTSKIKISYLILICIMALSAYLYIYDLDKYAFNVDEATYTAQSAIWAGHDEYRQNFLPYSRSATNFQLHQIITGIFIKFFGISEFVARLPTAIFGLLSILAIYMIGNSLFNSRVAIFSALFMGLNGYSLHFNRQINLDTDLVFFILLSILFIIRWQQTKKNWYFYLFLVSIILSMMSKTIIVIPLIPLVLVYLYIKKDIIKAIKMLFKFPSIIIILSSVIFVVYFIIKIVGIDLFLKTLLFGTGRESRNSSLFYIKVITLLFGYLFPIIAVIGLFQAMKYRHEGDVLCIIWFVFMTVFFTYYPLQGYNYIYPVIPSLCILGGRVIDNFSDKFNISKGTSLFFSVMVMVSIYPSFNMLDNPEKIVHIVAPTRFDPIKAGALKDTALWLKNNLEPNAAVATYSFADSHNIAFYSGIKTYAIKIAPGLYTPTNTTATMIWNNVDIIELIRNGDINYVVYMEEPKLTKSLLDLNQTEGIGFTLIYHNNYSTPDWYDNGGNLNISIFKVKKNEPVKMNKIKDSSFTVVTIPDTQIYAKDRPDILNGQMRWIIANKETLNIKFVIQTGDIVDTGNSVIQWKMVNKSFRILDGKIPYLVVPGNHDYNGRAYLRDLTSYNLNFNYERFENYSWYGGNYPSNRNENNYGFFTSPDGEDFLILGLEFCPRNHVLKWANDIIDKYPNKKVILFTHAYLNDKGERISGNTTGDYNSCSYARIEGNEGEDIYSKLVKKHDNIVLVISSHKLGVGKRIDYVGGNPTNQIIQNYQYLINGGNGFLRYYIFVPEEKRIDVRTYSTYINEYDSSPDNQFNLTYNNKVN